MVNEISYFFLRLKTKIKVFFVVKKVYVKFYLLVFLSRFKKSNDSGEVDWEAFRALAEKLTAPLPEGTVIESSLSEVEI